MKVVKDKTITDIAYIKAAGISAGLKSSNKKDLAMIYSEIPAVAAAVFTKNKVKAAPLLINMEHIKNKNTQAVVINSAYANACTGEEGLEDALAMTKLAGEILDLRAEEVLVASTGRIGILLPMDKIEKGIKESISQLSYDGGFNAGEAILTTDTFPKNIFVEFQLNNKTASIGAIAKGSGMIHPDMGTMLGFLTTDVNISKEMLDKALKDSVVDSYNMVSVDGDTSTNDMVVVLANGAAGNDIISEENENYYKFKEALDFVNKELSKQIAKDGEGATKLIECIVHNAATKEDAKICAKSVITSSLVKAAFFGSDANWGRILCALGYSGVDLDPNKIDISFKDDDKTMAVVTNGMGNVFDKAEVKELISQEKITIDIDLKNGKEEATAWGCDLTFGYVEINGYYET